MNAYEPIWHDGEVVGFVTSGGYSHYSEKSIAFGFVPNALVKEGQQVEIELLDWRRFIAAPCSMLTMSI